ncbi:MAG TPA: AMP-binding protein, partial [Citricoccus sp.]
MTTEPTIALSEDHGPTTTPLLEETIGQNLASTVERFGERDALVEVQTGRRWTYAEFAADVARLATGLLDAGITRGDRVGIWAPNVAEWTLVQYATAQVGAILVTINPAYRRDELQYALAASGIRTVIAASSFKTSDYERMLAEVRGDCPALQDVVILGTPAWDRLAATPADEDRLARVAAALAPDDPINIQYTSGTTGYPKGATLTHRNILNNGFFDGERVQYTEADRICIPVP